MPKVPFHLMSTAAGALLASTLLAATPAGRSTGATPPAQQQSAPGAADDPAAELFAQTCNRCHDGARITAIRRTKTDWEEVIGKMIERGATGSEEDFQTIFGYLRRHYGKVYINSATADEITTSLALPAKDADAILTYRKAHGDFPDFDAVKKVPEIDVKALDEHRDAVAF
jgi:competence ComEA-like helix-hairpin-helix protein